MTPAASRGNGQDVRFSKHTRRMRVVCDRESASHAKIKQVQEIKLFCIFMLKLTYYLLINIFAGHVFKKLILKMVTNFIFFPKPKNYKNKHSPNQRHDFRVIFPATQ